MDEVKEEEFYIPNIIAKELTTDLGVEARFKDGVVGVLFAYDSLESLRRDYPDNQYFIVKSPV